MSRRSAWRTLLSAVLLWASLAGAQDGTWSTKASLSAPRSLAASAVENGKVHVIAGWQGGNTCSYLSSQEVYDTTTNTWEAKAALPWSAEGVAAAELNGKIYALGGFIGCGLSTASVAAYDVSLNAWTSKAAMPTSRGRLAAAVINGVLYAAGGFAQGTQTVLRTLESYDPITNTWTTRAPMPTARYNVGGAVINGIFYVAGGYDNAHVLSTLEAYDPSTNTWTTKASMPSPVQYPTVVANNGLLYVMGGGGGAVSNLVQVYNPALNVWSFAVPMGVSRAGAAGGSAGSSLYVIGGHDDVGAVLSANQAYAITLYKLLVAISGPGAVMSSPAGITCTAGAPTCATYFPSGSSVSLSASPFSGSILTGWSGACSGIGACTVLMETQQAVTATFGPAPVATSPLTVTLGGTGTGVVTSVPGGISCPNACTASFNSGSAITLSPTTATGSFFAGWSGGGCTGNGSCTLTLTTPTSITATFSHASLEVTPSSIDFGGQSTGTTSLPITVTLANNSVGTVTVTSVAASAGFAVSHSCANLAPSHACSLSVSFAPQADGIQTGALSIQTDAGTRSVNLAGTGEHSLVSHYYEAILGRAPDAGGKAFWESEAARVQSLGSNVNETWFAMTAAFFFSSEYRALGRNDAGFVTDLYQTFFNRAPDAGGLSFWSGQLAQGVPREVVLVSFMLSNEFVSFTAGIFGGTAVRKEIDTVMDFYRGLLARLPDNDGFAYWVGQFRDAQCKDAGAVYAQAEAISSAFINGPEYAGRGRTNAQFVGDLYNAFLRRGGDAAGVQFWISELNRGARSRDQVRQAFIATPEFQARVSAVVAEGCGPLESVTQMVSAGGGGTITLPSGSSVKIPAHALNADQYVTLSLMRSPHAQPVNQTISSVGNALSLSFATSTPFVNPVPDDSLIFKLKYGSIPSRLTGSAAAVDVVDDDNIAGIVTSPLACDPSSTCTAVPLPHLQLYQRLLRVDVFDANIKPPQELPPAPVAGVKSWNGARWQDGVPADVAAKDCVLLVHGMASCVSEAFSAQSIQQIMDRGQYNCVLGFDYDWSNPINQSGKLLSDALSALRGMGVQRIDIDAHSEGGVVSMSAACQNSDMPISNLVMRGSPVGGTPAATGATAVQVGAGAVSATIKPVATTLLNSVDSCAASTNTALSSVVLERWAQDMRPGSDVLTSNASCLLGKMNASGNLASTYVTCVGAYDYTTDRRMYALGTATKYLFGVEPFDGVVGKSSAMCTSVNFPSTRVSRNSFPIAHTQLPSRLEVTAYVGAITSAHRTPLTCTIQLSAPVTSFTASGGSGILNVTASGACAWQAASNASWLTITAHGTGTTSQVVDFTVAPNSGITSRTATVTVGTQSITITQAATVPPGYFSCSTHSCDYSCGHCTGIKDTMCQATARITAPVPAGGQCDLNPYCQSGYSCIGIEPGGLGFPTCQAKC